MKNGNGKVYREDDKLQLPASVCLPDSCCISLLSNVVVLEGKLDLQ